MRNLRFSDLEGVRIAAEMERRGGEFYRYAAKISKNPEARELLRLLADDEKTHEREFVGLAEALQAARPDGRKEQFYDEETSAYLSAVAAEVVFSGGLMSLVPGKGFESPCAILANSIQSEKDSILFYSEMKVQARDEQARSVFDEIVRQEKHHLGRLQKMLNDLPMEE